MVAFHLWDHFGRRVTPMLAVYATATVVVTVAAGTRCAWYGLTGPLDAEQLPPGPRNLILDTILAVTNSYSTVPVLLWGCTGQPNPQIGLKYDVTPPLSGDGPGYPLPFYGVIEPPPGFALRRGVKRYPEPMVHGPEACELSHPCGSR